MANEKVELETVMMDMTEERRDRLLHVSEKIFALLRQELPSPIEAHAVLSMLLQCMEDRYDIHATIFMKNATDKVQ